MEGSVSVAIGAVNNKRHELPFCYLFCSLDEALARMRHDKKALEEFNNSSGAEKRRARFSGDLVGQRYGMLKVLKYAGVNTKHRKSLWLCACDCGQETTVSTSYLRGESKNPKNCGCLRKH